MSPSAPDLPIPTAQGSEKTIHDSFRRFAEARILVLDDEGPGRLRLDGRTSGGNPTAFGRFRHNGRVWRVNADSHVEPLLMAYHDEQDDPFVEVVVNGVRQLELRPELQARRGTPHKHLYIYEDLRADRVVTGRTASDSVGTAARGRQLAADALRARGATVHEVGDGRSTRLEAEIPGRAGALEIRVKSRTAGTWQGRASDGDPDPEEHANRFWIFVDLEAAKPAFFIAPDDWVRRDIHRHHQAYLERHGGQRALAPDSDHHAIQPARLRQWRDRWDLLGLSAD